MIRFRAPNDVVYCINKNTRLVDFVLWAETEGYRVKWVRQ